MGQGLELELRSLPVIQRLMASNLCSVMNKNNLTKYQIYVVLTNLLSLVEYQIYHYLVPIIQILK